MLKMALSAIATGACVLAVLPGCSFIYDPSDLALGGDAGGDGDADRDGGDDDATPPVDAEVDELELEIEPRGVFEGAGSSGAPIPIVLRGEGLSADLDIAPDSDLVAVESIVVGDEGALAAAAIRVAVEPKLPRGQTEVVTLTVTQPGAIGTVELDVVGLNELPLSGARDVGDGSFDELYSEITIDGAELTGSAPARLVATGSITVTGNLRARGGSTGRTEPGPGGCEGGSPEEGGACPGGGGGASGGGAGGGGGGHAEPGDPGSGDADDRGDGGERDGDRFVTPLGDDGGSRGGGGGGGHAGALSNAGAGGGGGGIVELTSWGAVKLDALTDADGAAGGTGGGISCGGGGGGGSGGAILIRAGGRLSAAGGSLRARGGPGGDSGCDTAGGSGADGRIRIDAGGANLPADLDVTPDPVRGPMWRDELPAIVRAPTLRIDFMAQPAFTYRAAVGGEFVDEDEPDVSGSGRVTVELEEGLNEVCLVIPEGPEDSLPESRNCRDIAYVP